MNTKRMYNFLLELAKIPSVSPGSEEKRIAETIYKTLASEPYFQANGHQLRLLPIPGDRLGRQSVYAMVRAEPRTSKTIIMIGHLDVVETREARDLAELAYHPEEYTRRLHERMLPQSARRDLESGDFLFGRGVFDMKCGVAAEVELMRKASLNPGSLQRNLMMLIVGDEENQSAGMLSAVEHLVRIQEDEDLEFVVCVNTEGETQKYAGDTNRYVSLGTIGKMMPVFYCVGRESHVGSHYEGLNANLLASAVNMVLEGSPEWADKVGSEVYPPPTALKHRDLRDVYSVTLPARAVTYFNYLFVNKTPGVALEMMKTVAREAFDMALERMRYSAERFSAKGDSVVEIRWQPKVITYKELVDSVRESFDSASQDAAGLPMSSTTTKGASTLEPSASQDPAAPWDSAMHYDPATFPDSGGPEMLSRPTMGASTRDPAATLGMAASQEAGELLESTASPGPTASLDPTASPGLTSSVGVTASRDPVTTPGLTASRDPVTAPDLTASQASTAPSSAFDLHIRSFTDALPSDMDDRDKSISIMGEVLRHYEDKEPVIIVGFLPPFYPHRTNLRESSRELGIVRAVEELADQAKDSYGETLKVNEHFVAISDLSYVGFHGTREDILPLTENTPGWGRVYNLPVEALLKLNIPVLNIGPSGRDAHNFTERLHLPYYLGAYPKLLESLIERLSLIP